MGENPSPLGEALKENVHVQIYRTTSHTKYDLKYHLVWITKYRRAVPSGAVGTRVRELVREICRANDIEIVKGHVGKDHVHLFVSVPPYPVGE